MAIVVNNSFQKFFSYTMGQKVNSPEQRFIQGVTAIFSQPLFDFYNKKADDETRIVSVARTMGKIIAGTTVGVLVRYLTIAIAKKFSNYTIVQTTNDGLVKKVVPKTPFDILMPKIKYKKPRITPEMFAQRHTNYMKALGTILGTFTMVYTNFAIDAPCTRYLTEKFKPIVRKCIQLQEAKNDSSK